MAYIVAARLQFKLMGFLRVILALSVVVAHIGPLFGLRFFGGGVMAVETFYMLSGFYMALVLSTRYRGRTRDFYFNRFLRLFPAYWLLVVIFLIGGLLYWLVSGNPLGALAAWHASFNPLGWIWAGISNLTMVGADWAELYSYQTTIDGNGINRLIAIQPIWSLAVEITFYLASPYILRQGYFAQGLIFIAALLMRMGIWVATGSHWTIWIYYFSPATWVFFMAGVQAYHLMKFLESRSWFARLARPIGVGCAVMLVLLVACYVQIGIFQFQDWRYYVLVGLALPFLFTAFRGSPFDAAIAAWSYPIYLSHWVVRSVSPPLRHFVPESGAIYVNLFLTLILSSVVIRIDGKIQHRFKHIV